MTDQEDPTWKEGPRRWVIAVIMVPIIALMVFLIKWPNYQECRQHGFSKLYCSTGR